MASAIGTTTGPREGQADVGEVGTILGSGAEFAVMADGMGTPHIAAHVASGLVQGLRIHLVRPAESEAELGRAVLKAYYHARDRMAHVDGEGMPGTTLSAVIKQGDWVATLQLGDSSSGLVSAVTGAPVMGYRVCHVFSATRDSEIKKLVGGYPPLEPVMTTPQTWGDAEEVRRVTDRWEVEVEPRGDAVPQEDRYMASVRMRTEHGVGREVPYSLAEPSRSVQCPTANGMMRGARVEDRLALLELMAEPELSVYRVRPRDDACLLVAYSDGFGSKMSLQDPRSFSRAFADMEGLLSRHVEEYLQSTMLPLLGDGVREMFREIAEVRTAWHTLMTVTRFVQPVLPDELWKERYNEAADRLIRRFSGGDDVPTLQAAVAAGDSEALEAICEAMCDLATVFLSDDNVTLCACVCRR